MTYLFLILAAMVIITAANAAVGVPLAAAAGATALATAAVIALDGITAFLIRRMPERRFSYDGRIFAVGHRESAFYRRIQIKRWKGIVPDLGCFTSFPKRHLVAPSDPAYTGRYLLEAAYGIVVHAVHIPAGFLILSILADYRWSVALPVACVNAVLSLLPLLLLRSNLPALIRVHRHNLKKKNTRQG